MPQPLYDRIGRRYTLTRRPDPRIAAAIVDALGDASTVVNVGAGTGAYEPVGPSLVAVEPSWQMIRQRAAGTTPVIQASAEALPFRTGTFDAALAVLTLHHWADWRAGLDEMKRVANRLVVFTFDTSAVGNFWLTEAYFPEIVELYRGRCPSVAEMAHYLDAEGLLTTNSALDPTPPAHLSASRTASVGSSRPASTGCRSTHSAFSRWRLSSARNSASCCCAG